MVSASDGFGLRSRIAGGDRTPEVPCRSAARRLPADAKAWERASAHAGRVAAALCHHFVKRNDILRRMLVGQKG